MGAPEHRYTDAHVRGDNELRDVAWAYARDYLGDWEVMVAARDLARQAGELPVPIARMVLNVMRVDPNAQQHLRPVEHAKIIPLTPRNTEPVSRSWGSIDEDEVFPEGPQLVRPPMVVSTKWHKRYILSTHKLATLAHLLKPESLQPHSHYNSSFSKLPWLPTSREYEVHIVSYCAKSWSSRRMYVNDESTYIDRINKIGVVVTDDAQGRKVCKNCLLKEELFEERNEA